MSPQELIKKSQRVVVSLGSQTRSSDMADALLLLSVLKKLGKDVALEQKKEIPSSFAWVDTLSLSVKTAVLAIRDIAPFVSKISYEKNERDLKFSLALKENLVGLSRVEIEKPPEADLILIVGENLVQHNQEVTLDPRPQIWNARKALEAGILLLSPFHIPLIRLFQRTLLKLEYQAEKALCIALLEKKDFVETQTSIKNLPQLATEFSQRGTLPSSYLFIFPVSERKNRGLFYTNQKPLREKIAHSFGVTEKGCWVLFESLETNPQKIKEKFLSEL